MTHITITGASDDLIEVEGDIREEFGFFPADERDTRLLAVSDGTLLRVSYDADGIWRLAKVVGGSAELYKIEGDAEADTNDKVHLTGDIKWVVLGGADVAMIGG
jgi:hypothetical protein